MKSCYTERHNFAYLRCFSSRRCDVLEVRLTPRLRHCRRRACQGPALLDREAKSKTLRSMKVCFVLSLCTAIIYVVVYICMRRIFYKIGTSMIIVGWLAGCGGDGEIEISSLVDERTCVPTDLAMLTCETAGSETTFTWEQTLCPEELF